MAGEPLYCISPHADDGAFSCAGSLALAVLSGRPVTLITAFLSGSAASARRAEDERAAALLGCGYKCLDLPDAPDRPEVRGSLDIFMPFGPQHLGITNEVVSRLLWHIAPPAAVYAPLGVGGHIDHRIVHEASRALAYHLGRGLQLAFYEDQPYSLVPYALGRRLDGLGLATFGGRPAGTERATLSMEVAAYRKSLLAWPMNRRHLPGLRHLACHLIGRRAVQADLSGQRPGFPPRLRPVGTTLFEAAAELRRQAVCAYASQVPQFADSAASLLQALDAHGRRYSEAGTPCERLWFDDGVCGT